MRCHYFLLLLVNTFSLLLCLAPQQYNFENKSYGDTNRYINFGGNFNIVHRSREISQVSYEYLTFTFYSTINGFLDSYTFKLYFADPSYAYMTCTIPSATTVTYNFECELDIEKFMLNFGTKTLPEEFPQIDNCQILGWENVEKSFYLFERAEYDKSFRYSTTFELLCNSDYKNIFSAEGTLYNRETKKRVPNDFSFYIPAYVDGIETTIPCSVYGIEDTTRGHKCYISGKKNITLFNTLVTYDNVKIWFELSWESKLIDCRNPDRMIRFIALSAARCNTYNFRKSLILEISAHIFGFNQEEKFILPLEEPSFEYCECTIPKSPFSSGEKLLYCVLDIYKFPLYTNQRLILPNNFPDINCEIYNWEDVHKTITGQCYPTFDGEISPQIIHEPKCIKEDYNMILFSSTISLTLPQNHYSFDLNVLIDGKNEVLPCEFFTRSFYNENYYPMFCFSNKGNGTISFFETIITLDNQYTTLFNIDTDKKVNLNICSVSEKTIFFENINIVCSNEGNQYFVIAQLYAKISGFTSDYSFNLYLDSPSTYYMSCTIPGSKSDIRKLTYIECKLDILKFPLIEQTSIYLPSNLPLEDINIINWDKMIKVHDCKNCNPQYSLVFSSKEYLETSCYKPYHNKISIKGKIEQKGKSYSFEMNAFVDEKIALLPCKLYSQDENSDDYQLDCITNGTKSIKIYTNFVRDINSKELIYIKGSNIFTIKECNPTKFITFNKIESQCSSNEKILKIYFYADIEGFSDEVIFNVYLEKPSYINMKCIIPKSDGINQHIYCTIDVNKFPLISIEEITFPSEFYIHPECEIKNWEKMNKNLLTKECSDSYKYKFSPIKYLNTECYLNGYNSFAIEGIMETNINDLKIRKIKYDVYAKTIYNTISCEIYPPDSSNVNSRLYCYSPCKNDILMFPTITEDENYQEKIFINIEHIFNIKSCPQENKMIYFKGIESECLLNESSLRLLIYSDIVGFNTEEKIIIDLNYPNPAYLECIIPGANSKDYIECIFDISKFPLMTENSIKLPDTFPKISDCYISNWININKEITTGKCYNDYSLVFSQNKTYETKCYEKNYNVITIFGSLSKNGFNSLDNKTIYSFTLNSFVDGNYDHLKCEIYPPDSSFSQHRMFCYTNKINSVKIFPTMINTTNSHEIIFINTTNYDFNLSDCSSNDKLIFLKGINLKYSETLIYINFYGKISGTTKEELFSITLDEPNYSNIECLFPSSEIKDEDSLIECKYNITKFPLIYTDKIIMPNKFPILQNYSLSNWDFINKDLYIGYKHSNYSIRFIVNDYINASCYKKGYNVFSAIGSFKLYDNYKNITINQIFKFNNYILIDGIYTYISCRAFPNLNKTAYQMDCYTNGTSYAKIFPTISLEEKNHELIFIDYLKQYSLLTCSREISKKINFQSNNQPQCIENGKALMLSFNAYIYGFSEEENFILEVYTLINGNRDNIDAYCTIPFQINGKNSYEINCTIDTQKFPFIGYTSINLPYSFPNIKNCVTSYWFYIYRSRIYTNGCHHPYDMEFKLYNYNFEQNCKSNYEAIISIDGYITNSYGSREIYNLTLPVVLNDNYIQEISCLIYPPEKNYYSLSHMDCNVIVGYHLRFYTTIAQDIISQKFILIDDDKKVNISYCYNYDKFINFDGKIEIKPNLESSQLQLLLYSKTINFEKEETLRFNLNYPKYSYIDCVIPASNSNNNEYITCSLDTNKFPLTSNDSIILPSELKVEKYSFTKWNRITKELTNISCAPNYTNIFYSLEQQDSAAKCDDKGNNLITISGTIDSPQANNAYNLDILGIVDSQYKSINCSLNITQGINQILCSITGNNSAKIFQTIGVDSQKKDKILIKVHDHLNYTLSECKPKSSSTLTIVIIIVSIVVALIIAFVIFIIVRKKRRESKSDVKINTLINEVGELQEK